MELQKRRNLFWVVLGLLAIPAPTRAETDACGLLTKADVEAVTGMQVTETKSESLKVCAGLCETTTGWRCIYTGTLSGARHVVALSVELPPYIRSNLIDLDEATAKADKDRQTVRMQVLGRPALWAFGGSDASLHIFDGNDVHFLIQEDGVTRDEVALRHARAMAARVYDRFKGTFSQDAPETPGRPAPSSQRPGA